MKHLKTFNALNESLQEASVILDFLRDSPEGNDLFKIGRNKTFEESFEARRSGRVHVIGFGSKTYIDKSDRGYCFQTLSNGKIFGQECYPTIGECVRQLWSSVIGRTLSVAYGVKKDEIRKWALANIPVGRGLGMKEIVDEYARAEQKEEANFLDVAENSKMFKLVQDVFKTNIVETRLTHSQKKSGSPEYVLSVDAFKPFGLDICNYGDKTPNISLSIKTNLSGKNSLKMGYPNRLTLGDSATASNHLDKAIPSFVMKSLSDYKNTPYVPGVPYGAPFCQELIEIVRSIFTSSGDSASSMLDSFLNLAKNNNPLIFSSVIKRLESLGTYPELVSKYRGSDSDIIKGGSLLGRLGLGENE